ncbi:MAG: FkbM family methyltransferase [archaeon]|nr:FkbM family methyltransferase [archaeon]
MPNIKAKNFCYDFEHSNRPKYIFGRNELAKSIAVNIEIDGFIDDFTSETIYCNKPIVSIENVPNNALVVVVVVGKPLIAEKRVSQFQFEYIDYFSFYKYSDLSISNIMFWDGMIDDIKSNLSKYKQIYELLYDKESKNQMYNILNFRVAYDINYMRGFSAKEDVQYFEEFLNLQENNEVFVDVGGFDGYTSEEFIKKCPNYSSVHIFEPEESNFLLAQDRLSKYQNINYYKKGLSNKKESLKFDVCGSSSKINVDGQLIIAVDRLDDLLDQKITFIKMDIEGAEGMAIEGAKQTIKKYHPKLAISVYHKIDDFWKIPEQILKIREDYTIYLRHYTEGISETVMFFIPKI